MANKSLSKVPSSIQQSAAKKPAGEPETVTKSADDLDAHLTGLAGYLVGASQATHDRFELQKMAEIGHAKKLFVEALEMLNEAQIERRLSLWIRSHPDKKKWQEEPPAPPNALFHNLQEREAIRRAYEQFGCDMCGTKERPHIADGLCRRCYNVRSYRRRKALTLLEDEKETTQK